MRNPGVCSRVGCCSRLGGKLCPVSSCRWHTGLCKSAKTTAEVDFSPALRPRLSQCSPEKGLGLGPDSCQRCLRGTRAVNRKVLEPKRVFHGRLSQEGGKAGHR